MATSIVKIIFVLCMTILLIVFWYFEYQQSMRVSFLERKIQNQDIFLHSFVLSENTVWYGSGLPETSRHLVKRKNIFALVKSIEKESIIVESDNMDDGSLNKIDPKNPSAYVFPKKTYQVHIKQETLFSGKKLKDLAVWDFINIISSSSGELSDSFDAMSISYTPSSTLSKNPN